VYYTDLYAIELIIISSEAAERTRVAERGDRRSTVEMARRMRRER
jgi:hypothetical protein